MRQAPGRSCRQPDATDIGRSIRAFGCLRHDAGMDTPTSEQRQRFERLCTLRALYAQRGSRDTTSVMTVDAAIRYGEALLRPIDGVVRADSSEAGDSAI